MLTSQNEFCHKGMHECMNTDVKVSYLCVARKVNTSFTIIKYQQLFSFDFLSRWNTTIAFKIYNVLMILKIKRHIFFVKHYEIILSFKNYLCRVLKKRSGYLAVFLCTKYVLYTHVFLTIVDYTYVHTNMSINFGQIL